MRLPDGPMLLDIADAASGVGAAHRSILLLAACDPNLTPDEAAALDIARFDARMLDVCETCLGNVLLARAHCPSCRTALDLELDARSLRQDLCTADTELQAERDGVAVRFRLPTARDLAIIEGQSDPDAARADLLSRCVLGLDGAEALSPGLLDEMSRALADAAPQADVTVALACAACAHRWEALLDLGTFLWRDLSYRAALLSQDVHTLASAYHWSEDTILAMSASRRRRYIELIQL